MWNPPHREVEAKVLDLDPLLFTPNSHVEARGGEEREGTFSGTAISRFSLQDPIMCNTKQVFLLLFILVLARCPRF